MHATPARRYSFSRDLGDTTPVYKSSGFMSFQGNSGGPLCVETNLDNHPTYFPAAIYLGQSEGYALVRFIDRPVVRLINLAASSADLGTNFTGFGVLRFLPAEQKAGPGLKVLIEPSSIAPQVKWRVAGAFGGAQFSSGETIYLDPKHDWVLEFTEVPGFSGPPASDRTIRLKQGVGSIFTATFVPSDQTRPQLKLSRGPNGLRFTWPASAQGYVLESTSDLGPSAAWIRHSGDPVRLADEWAVDQEPSARRRFYRLKK
jgi:hypothetical protein